MARISYQEANLPQPWQILGLRLKPFCIGHYLHLARFNVAFVSREYREAKLVDIILTALVCSMTYEEFWEFLSRADFKQEIKEWGAKAGTQFELRDKVALINRYIAEGIRQPAVIYEGEVSESGADPVQVLKVSLLQMGYTKSEAMNLPMTEGFADFYRRAEENGVVRIADPKLAAALDQAEPGPNIIDPEGKHPTSNIEQPTSNAGESDSEIVNRKSDIANAEEGNPS